jgi:plasmid replication initiation protein
MTLIKYNTREHKELLRVFSHSSTIEAKICMCIANAINKIPDNTAEEYRQKQQNYVIEIPVIELAENISSSYQSISNICDKLTSKKIKLQIPYTLKSSGETELFECVEVIFPSVGISNNIFKLKINSDVLPLFSRTLKIYRHYNIIEAKFLTHKHSIEMYKFLKDKLNRGVLDFTISVEKMRFELGLDDKYKAYKDFKKRVLEPAKKDMKRNGIVWFDYKEIKRSRSVIYLFFYIYKNKQKETNIYLSERLKLYTKQTTENKFKKDFKDFLEKDFCVSLVSKTLNKTEFQSQLKLLEKRISLTMYPMKIQEQFIEYLEPKLL